MIAEFDSHIMRYEAGGMAAISGVVPETIMGIDGQFTPQQVLEHFHPGSRHTPRMALLAVEQTCNLAGGTVWPTAQLQAVAAQAKALGMKTHMDGARLFNAADSAGNSAAEHCRQFDSVWVDFTKGMGAPFGAVLCGSRSFIDQAWAWKHRLGGAMRQAGMMAAGCLYALEHNIENLAQDHENASLLNEGLKRNPHVAVRHDKTATNIVYFSLRGLDCTPQQFVDATAKAGLRIGIVGRGMRAITYNGISRNDIEKALTIVEEVTRRYAVH